MPETPTVKYRINRKGYDDRFIETHTILFERHHVVFVEASGQILAAFRAEDVTSVVRVEGNTISRT